MLVLRMCISSMVIALPSTMSEQNLEMQNKTKKKEKNKTERKESKAQNYSLLLDSLVLLHSKLFKYTIRHYIREGTGGREKQMFSNYEPIFTVRWCHVFKLQIRIF